MRRSWSDVDRRRALAAVVLAVLLQASPAWGVAALGIVAGAVVGVMTGMWLLLHVFAAFGGYVASVLVGAFALHEVMHVVASSIGRRDARFSIELRVVRCSVHPLHATTRARRVGAAIAGPASCVAAGVVLAMCGAPAIWTVPFVAHAASLLPCFGDGRSIVAAVRDAGIGPRDP